MISYNEKRLRKKLTAKKSFPVEESSFPKIVAVGSW